MPRRSSAWRQCTKVISGSSTGQPVLVATIKIPRKNVHAHATRAKPYRGTGAPPVVAVLLQRRLVLQPNLKSAAVFAIEGGRTRFAQLFDRSTGRRGVPRHMGGAR